MKVQKKLDLQKAELSGVAFQAGISRIQGAEREIYVKEEKMSKTLRSGPLSVAAILILRGARVHAGRIDADPHGGGGYFAEMQDLGQNTHPSESYTVAVGWSAVRKTAVTRGLGLATLFPFWMCDHSSGTGRGPLPFP
jgi:hypothetical protein